MSADCSDLEMGSTNDYSKESTIHHTETNDCFVFNGTRVPKSAVLPAYGGTLFPGLHTAPSRKFASPTPMGLMAYAATTFFLSLMNVGTRGIATNSIIVSLCYFHGGLVMLIAAIWEIVSENAFAATVFGTFGGFWLSFGGIAGNIGNLQEAYADKPQEFSLCIGLFLLTYFMVAVVFTLLTLRTTYSFFLMFVTVDTCFLLLGIAYLYSDAVTGAPNIPLTRAGGAFGLATASLATYNAYAGLWEPTNSFKYLKPYPLPLPFSQEYKIRPRKQ